MHPLAMRYSNWTGPWVANCFQNSKYWVNLIQFLETVVGIMENIASRNYTTWLSASLLLVRVSCDFSMLELTMLSKRLHIELRSSASFDSSSRLRTPSFFKMGSAAVGSLSITICSVARRSFSLACLIQTPNDSFWVSSTSYGNSLGSLSTSIWL